MKNSPNPTVLVTGATGKVGRNVVRLLLEAGVPVRATSRDPQRAGLPAEVDVRFGDLGDPGTFADALAGVAKVFLFPEPSGAEGVLAAAVRAGVRQVVALSSMAVSVPDPTANPIAHLHLLVEQQVERSGLAWTIVRPGAFAANTLQWAQAIRQGEGLPVAYPDATMSPIHERDIAAVAAEALLSDGHTGATYEITGPESLTQRRQIELIAAAIGRPVRVVGLSGEEARAQVEKQFGPYPPIVDTVLSSLAGSVHRPAEITDVVRQVTGRPARTFADWAVEHKAAFAS